MITDIDLQNYDQLIWTPTPGFCPWTPTSMPTPTPSEVRERGRIGKLRVMLIDKQPEAVAEGGGGNEGGSDDYR